MKKIISDSAFARVFCTRTPDSDKTKIYTPKPLPVKTMHVKFINCRYFVGCASLAVSCIFL